MILRNILTAVICVGTFGDVLGISYSNVYFQLGTKGVPVDYVNYGVQGAYPSSQAQQAVAPLTSVIPVLPASTLVAACPSPCINPNGRVNNEKLVTPKSPSKPVDDASANYEYSYVVFDDKTGDEKAQREVSNGGKVRGQYSLVQPDGYIREVQYTADDLKGFTAFVTNFYRGKITNSVSDNLGIKDSAPLQGPNNVPIGEPRNRKPQQGTVNTLTSNKVGKEQPAEIKEIKPRPTGISQGTPDEISVPAAVKEIKPKPNGPTREALTEPYDVNAYNNIIKCIQMSTKISESPLVYIIMPSKPCP